MGTDGSAGFVSASFTGGGSPTGPAGGDLEGTYPNPTIVAGAASTNLGNTPSATTNIITSDTGTDATVNLATPSGGTNLSGLLSPGDKDKIDSTSGTNTGDQTITLTGEATGTGTGSFATTLTNASVIGKVLTGFSSNPGTVSASDSLLQAIQKMDGNVSALDAGVILKGSWDASSGSFPGGGVAQAGWSYIVSVAGTVDSVSFNINDRIIAITDNASTTTFTSNWFKADYTDQVLSVFTRTGAVTSANGDYIASQITNTPAGGISGINVQSAIDELDSDKVAFNNSGANLSIELDSSSSASFIIDRQSSTLDESTIKFKTAGVLDWLIGMDDAPTSHRSNYVIKTTENGNPEFTFASNGNFGIGMGNVTPSFPLFINKPGGDHIRLTGTSGTDVTIAFGPFGAIANAARIKSVTSGSNADLQFLTKGSTKMRLLDGLQMGSPTGADKGVGTINLASDIYKNNSAYTNPDYVFEHYFKGEIEKFKENPGASEYKGLLPIDNLKEFVSNELFLPGIKKEGDAGVGMFERGDRILEKMEEAHLYIIQLHERIVLLENYKGVNK